MIFPILILLSCQLAGELLSRMLSLPLPGPVAGMLILLALHFASSGMPSLIRPLAAGLLAHLSLMFVPVGVGILAYPELLSVLGLELFGILALSTIAALIVTVLTFVLVSGVITGGRTDGI